MKKDKILCRCCFILSLIVFCLWGICLFLRAERTGDAWGFGVDMQLRRNEVLCAHQGVNSFRIWNHEVALKGFKPLTRPDMVTPPCEPTDRSVQAYPPWHTVFFWWYGRLPVSACIAFMSCFFGLCVAVAFSICRHFIIQHCTVVAPALAFVVMATVGDVIGCFFLLNYGVMILAGGLILGKLLEQNRQFCAGIVWALMMVKPQVGMLFFWPIFFKRKYVTIVTAVCVCLFMTVLMARCYGEAPLDLILQIPQLGAPYGNGKIVDTFLTPFLGRASDLVVMGCFFAFCGWWCCKFRLQSNWMLNCLPVVVCVPLWTYSNGYDCVVTLVWYAVVAILAFGNARGVWLWYAVFVGVGSLLRCCWVNGMQLGWFCPTGWGWIYAGTVMAMNWAMLGMLIWLGITLPKTNLVNVRD